MEPMNFPLQYCPLLSSFLFYLGMTAVQISTQAPRLPPPPPPFIRRSQLSLFLVLKVHCDRNEGGGKKSGKIEFPSLFYSILSLSLFFFPSN